MKLLQVLFFAVLASFTISAQGIVFSDTDFEGAKAMAQEQDKLIFVDAYTTWCGPCKWMNKNVFTDASVGEYYNNNFINLKLDMEKGEGIAFSTKYEVNAYPTLLFINGKGEVIHKSIGGRPVVDFLDLGNAANDPERQVTTLANRYEKGDRSPAFLKNYTSALTSAGMKGFDVIAQEYMATQEDWMTEENMRFIFDYAEASIDSELFQFTTKHEDKFRALVGDEKYEQKIDYAADKDRSKAGIARNELNKLTLHYAKYYPVEQAKTKAQVTYFREAMYAKDPVEQEKFKSDIQLFLAGKPDLGWSFYNSVAWQVYEITEDRDLLKKASEWAQWSLDEVENSYNTDTKAAIEYKLGNMKTAKGLAEKSIKIAKTEGMDYSATEKLLEKILSSLELKE